MEKLHTDWLDANATITTERGRESEREREFFFYYVSLYYYASIDPYCANNILLRFYFLNSEENPSLWT